MDIELLYATGSGDAARVSDLIREILDSLNIQDPFRTIEIRDEEDTREFSFSGTTTMRIDGENVGVDLSPLSKTGTAFPDRDLLRYRIAKAAGLKTILFVCSGNAVRSQIAEGIVNHFLKGKWAAFSGGIIPMAVPRDLVRVMREIGIDLSGQRSKHVDVFRDSQFDSVIVLCSDVDRLCPNLPGCTRQELMVFDDPLSSSMFSEGFCFFGLKSSLRRLRDEMKKKLLEYLNE